MHPGPWRVGNDYVWSSMLLKKLVITNIHHISRKKTGMINLVQRRIFVCICYSFCNYFYPNHFFGQFTYKNANTSCSAIQIINNLGSIEFGKITGYLV